MVVGQCLCQRGRDGSQPHSSGAMQALISRLHSSDHLRPVQSAIVLQAVQLQKGGQRRTSIGGVQRASIMRALPDVLQRHTAQPFLQRG